MSDNLDDILEVKDKSKAEEKSEERNEYKFKSLRGYGRFISGLGWVFVFAGGIGLLIGLGIFADEEAIGLSVIGGSFIGILNGFFMVVFGQSVSCFVEIEKNTRMTHRALSK